MNSSISKIGLVVGLVASLLRPAAALLPGSLAELDVSLRPERDALIKKIAQGQGLEQSLERFVALIKERQQRRAAAQGLEEQTATQQNQVAEQKQGLDAVVGEHCALMADPKKPPRHAYSFMNGDWGRVIVKQEAQLPGRTPFDKPQPVTLYKIQGLRYTYVVSSKGPALWYEKPFSGSIGDLVLVCSVSVQSEGSGSKFPPDFRDHILSQGFAVRIKEPPLIVKKAALNPFHTLDGGGTIRVAIHQGEWTHPQKVPLVGRFMVKEELGMVEGHRRYLMAAGERDEFVLEVPSGLKNSELLKPYRFSWIIMDKPRPDLDRRTWVLVAQDIEARYVIPAD